jgi:hypothetical protein
MSSERPAAESQRGPGGALRAVGLGLLYAVLVVALLLLGRAGTSFIYQGF